MDLNSLNLFVILNGDRFFFKILKTFNRTQFFQTVHFSIYSFIKENDK